ncbi:uncharacterized protein cubi_01608 [Cryptosporidium ubiquitum]|uniref:Uncharacterized protein n=1 Tax=Cryptosporidium ubiquitum TaxID=857276 RepID=A0A1J4MFN3_9CRYT|nr:uncharacterized protein cubi_01608 [Cryptosporidium ubiquitum]OII72275.1 hypothetical protein cubi_01608 [Cryptosporidium ubiquitum]
MSKLNEFFEKKKQKSKGLGDLSGAKKPIIGGLKAATGDPNISSVISEGNIDDWSINADVKDTTDFFISSKNLSVDGLRKPTNSQMVVAVKTSKPDFDSNIWKSKTGDSSGTNGSSLMGKNSGEEEDRNITNNEEKEKPKETLKYNVRARLAARGQKVEFLNTKEAINSMPTLAAAVANTNKPKGSNLAPLHPVSSPFHDSSSAATTSTVNVGKQTAASSEIDHQQKESFCEENNSDLEKGKLPESDSKSDLEMIKQLRSCNLLYFNKEVLFNCIVDIEQSKLKYSNIVRDF